MILKKPSLFINEKALTPQFENIEIDTDTCVQVPFSNKSITGIEKLVFTKNGKVIETYSTLGLCGGEVTENGKIIYKCC